MEQYQKLFNLMSDRYGVDLLQTEMDDIATACLPLFSLPKSQECSETLATLLESLRANQRAFFTSAPGSLARQTALHESKRLEKELDRFLDARKKAVNEPPNLFS